MSQPARSTTLDPMNLHRRTSFDGRFTLRLLATVLALAGLISSGALAANGERSGSGVNSLLQTTAEPFARVTVVVHSCPDDTTASGYYQHAVRCDSQTKRYGVPLGLTNSGQTTFQYSQPDSNAALEWRPQLNAGGATTIAEVVSERLREPVVFCTLTPFGNGISNAPPTYDGREMRVNAGKMSLDLKFGDELYCQWYRFPGGVVAGEGSGDDNGDAASANAGASRSAPASASAAPSDDDASASPAGTAIGISAWTCDPGPGRDVFGSA